MAITEGVVAAWELINTTKKYGTYSNGGNQGSTQSRRGAGQANIALAVQTPDGDYACQSSKLYTEKSTIIQELTNIDGFITISEFSKSIGTLTVHNAQAIVLKNISNVCQEIAITVTDWRNDGGADAESDTTTDTNNSVDMNVENDGDGAEATVYRTWTMLLPAGDFIYLPTNRVIGYSPYEATTLESGANSPAGVVEIEPKDIHSGNEFKKVALFAGQAYGSGSDVLIDGTVSSNSATAVVVDDGDWFKVGDLLIMGNSQTEVVEVESVSGTTLNIKRGLLGSTAGALTNNHEIGYFFGNEYLTYDNGKCMTDQNGRFKQRGAFFGYGRSANQVADGVVPGSVAIGPFYTKGGYLDWGLQNVTAGASTGLAASTEYTFHLIVDEFVDAGFDGTTNEVAIVFTTDSSDVTWAGSSNAVLPKIQARFDALYLDATNGNSLYNKRVTIGIQNGDVRVTSLSNHSETRIGIGNVSGTSPFGVGRFPALSTDVPDLLGSEHGDGTTDDIVYGPASSLPPETGDDPVSGKDIKNTHLFLLDDGKGNLRHNGTPVGTINYIKGHCEFTYLPNAEFKIYAETLSAHSGGASYTLNGYNTIYNIKARSINAKANSKLEMTLLG